MWAVRAIANLAANNPNNQTKLGAAGACEFLVKTIRMSLPGDSSFEGDAASASTSTSGLGLGLGVEDGAVLVLSDEERTAML